MFQHRRGKNNRKSKTINVGQKRRKETEPEKKKVTKHKHISDYVTCKWVNVLVKTKYCQAAFLTS